MLNPASGRDRDGRLYLLPRIVAAGNESRVGLGEVVIERGEPVGIRREGVVLEPDAGWERSTMHAGVEDPRITWMPSLGVHLMTYVAYGPLGPQTRPGRVREPTQLGATGTLALRVRPGAER